MLKEVVGNNIRYYRVSRGLSQRELSEQLDISERQLVRIENSQIFPKTSLINKLSQILDVSIENLTLSSEKIILFRELFLHPSLGKDELVSGKLSLLDDYLNHHMNLLDDNDGLLLDLFEFNVNQYFSPPTDMIMFEKCYGEKLKQVLTKSNLRGVDYYLLATYLNTSHYVRKKDLPHLDQIVRLIVEEKNRHRSELFDFFFNGVVIRLLFYFLMFSQDCDYRSSIEELKSLLGQRLIQSTHFYQKGAYCLIQLIDDYYASNNVDLFHEKLGHFLSASLLFDGPSSFLKSTQKATEKRRFQTFDIVKFFSV